MYGNKHLSPQDALILEKYVDGRFRDPRDDIEKMHRLRDAGFLTCVTDTATGEDFLRTTPEGDREISINNAPIREKIHRMFGFMLNEEEYWLGSGTL